MLDGGKLTAFPPVVHRAATAVPTAQGVREDAERWGGSVRGGCSSWRERYWRAEGGRPELSMVFVFFVNDGVEGCSPLSSAKDSRKRK